MAKEKKNKLKNVSLKIENEKQISFSILDEPISKKDKFREVKCVIHDLQINKTLMISNDNTGLTMIEFRKKIMNIIITHKIKNVEKQFTTSKIDSITLTITRLK